MAWHPLNCLIPNPTRHNRDIKPENTVFTKDNVLKITGK